jgi:hypothetical protein
VVSLAPWLSLLLASDADTTFGAREVAALVVSIAIALALLIAAAGATDSGTWSRALAWLSIAAGVSVVPGAFAGAFYRAGAADPSAFSEHLSKVDALFLAVITFTTTGFRDLSPRSTTARVLVGTELLVALVVVAFALVLVLRRFVSRRSG